MHHAKNRGNKEIPLAILSRILAQSCVTLCLNYVGRVTHDCASILDSIAKGISLFPRFFAWCIPTSIFIQLNDFSTCWGERERAPSLVHSQAGGVTICYIFMLYICYIVRSSSPRINCSTLYATPVGPREIPERIRRKLYVYFKNTTSTFRISGIDR